MVNPTANHPKNYCLYLFMGFLPLWLGWFKMTTIGLSYAVLLIDHFPIKTSVGFPSHGYIPITSPFLSRWNRHIWPHAGAHFNRWCLRVVWLRRRWSNGPTAQDPWDRWGRRRWISAGSRGTCRAALRGFPWGYPGYPADTPVIFQWMTMTL